MSFDLVVFDPSHAPAERGAFLDWWHKVSRWDDARHDYNSPTSATPALCAWFMDMIADFPPMNGPHANQEMPQDEATLTDYTIGKAAIYASFAWSIAERAGDAVADSAGRHGLGVFNVSSPTGEVYHASPDGELQLIHSG